MESKRQLNRGSESECLRVDKMNDYSSISSDSSEDSKSPTVLKSIDKTQGKESDMCVN